MSPLQRHDRAVKISKSTYRQLLHSDAKTDLKQSSHLDFETHQKLRE